MNKRVSFCRNAGSRKTVFTVVLKANQHTTTGSIAALARNKLKIPKKKTIVLYEHEHGTKIDDDNLHSLVQNGTIINVSLGEPFISPQGIMASSSLSTPEHDIPKPPRWPAPFGKEDESDRGNQSSPTPASTPFSSSQPPQETTQNEPVVYIDLDGVLVDFDKGIQQLTGKHTSQLSPRALWQAIRKADDFFAHLDWTVNGRRNFELLSQAVGRHRIAVLSACANRDEYRQQKRQWCRQHLGLDIPVHVCQQSNQKANYCKVQGQCLIDDNIDLQQSWHARGGCFVHYQENLPNALAQLAKGLAPHHPEVAARIQAQLDLLNSNDNGNDDNQNTTTTTATKKARNKQPHRPFVQLVAIQMDPADLMWLETQSRYAETFQQAYQQSINNSTIASQHAIRPDSPHVTLAHFRQVKQAAIYERYGSLDGKSVEVLVKSLCWNDDIAALSVDVASRTTTSTENGSDTGDSTLVPPSMNPFPHITLWHREGVAAFESNDLLQMASDGAEGISELVFDSPKTLHGTISFRSKSPSSTKENDQTLNDSKEVNFSSNFDDRQRSPFIDLSGNVLQRFKQIARTNDYISLRQHDTHFSVDYKDLNAFRAAGKRTKEDEMYLQECRGLLLSPKTGCVLARRFHKFYNVHEVPEATNVDIRGAILLEKLDGMLVSPFLDESTGTLLWASRQERNENVDLLVDRLDSDIRYNEFARHWIEKGFTPLFECVSTNLHKGIVRYDEERLVLLGLRHMNSGVYVPWDETIIHARRDLVPVARTIRRIQDETMEDLLTFVQNQVASAEEIEGVVLILRDNQQRFKIKTKWYLNQSQLETCRVNSKRTGPKMEPAIVKWCHEEGSIDLHWADIPTSLIWELALWDWLSQDESNSDDMLPMRVQCIHEATGCPVKLLLFALEEIRTNLLSWHRDLLAWATDHRVKHEKLKALQLLKRAGYDSATADLYFSEDEEHRDRDALRQLARFMYERMVKKREWHALKSALRQTFVSLPNLQTDTQLLLKNLFPVAGSKLQEPVTVVLRGLPSSGKSFVARNVLVPYFESELNVTDIQICSADDEFIDENGSYNFVESRLQDAHESCRQAFVNSKATVKIVDNTNSTQKEYLFYKRKSECRFVVMEIHGQGKNQQQNNHGVPPWVVSKMKERWEEDPDAIHIHNFHILKEAS